MSFANNLGYGRAPGKPLANIPAALNRGDYDGALPRMGPYVKQRRNGRLDTVPGLVNRRVAEARLWARGEFVASWHVAPAAPSSEGQEAAKLGGYAAAAATAALVLTNAQSELTALERGTHALRSGMTVRAYAESVGRARKTVDAEVRAAKVLAACAHLRNDVADIGHIVSHNVLSEIHAAPEWLWPALVAAAEADDWTVERTRAAVKALEHHALKRNRLSG